LLASLDDDAIFSPPWLFQCINFYLFCLSMKCWFFYGMFCLSNRNHVFYVHCRSCLCMVVIKALFSLCNLFNCNGDFCFLFLFFNHIIFLACITKLHAILTKLLSSLLEFRNDNISSEVAVHRKNTHTRSSIHLNRISVLIWIIFFWMYVVLDCVSSRFCHVDWWFYFCVVLIWNLFHKQYSSNLNIFVTIGYFWAAMFHYYFVKFFISLFNLPVFNFFLTHQFCSSATVSGK
jgi:hypothetical protein